MPYALSLAPSSRLAEVGSDRFFRAVFYLYCRHNFDLATRSWIAFLALLVCLTGDAGGYQDIIELPASAVIEYSGKGRDVVELSVKASLVDGFTYRLPCEIKSVSDRELVDITASTICRCVSMILEQQEVTPSKSAKGFVYLKPRGELSQIVNIHGVQRGETELIAIAKLHIVCQVFSPIRLSPARINLQDQKLVTDKLVTEVANGVNILNLSVVDSQTQLSASFDKERREITLHNDKPITKDGSLFCRFEVDYEGAKGVYEHVVFYGPRRAIRTVPTTVVLRKTEKGKEGKVVVFGISNEHDTDPEIEIKRLGNNGDKLDTKILASIDRGGVGKAVIALILPPEEQLELQTENSYILTVKSRDRGIADEVRFKVVE